MTWGIRRGIRGFEEPRSASGTGSFVLAHITRRGVTCSRGVMRVWGELFMGSPLGVPSRIGAQKLGLGFVTSPSGGRLDAG